MDKLLFMHTTSHRWLSVTPLESYGSGKGRKTIVITFHAWKRAMTQICHSELMNCEIITQHGDVCYVVDWYRIPNTNKVRVEIAIKLSVSNS